MTTRRLIAKVNELETLAKRNKNNAYHDAARNAMRQAQNIWTPALGIPKPDFTDEAWRDLDTDQMERMSALAERNALTGWASGATAALEAARIAWERLADPRLPRPRIPRGARRALERTTVMGGRQGGNWTTAQLSRVEEDEFRCHICIEDLSGSCYKHDLCRNIFCCECLDTWMSMSRTCPLCRQNL
jgi:hypothetical protein